LEKYGFVYIWYDKKHRRFYIGSHWGTEDDGYICSSTWMRQSYKRRKDDFKRRIIKTNIKDKKELLKEENKWLNLVKINELGKRYYNLKNVAAGGATRIGQKNSVEMRRKIGEGNKGKKLSKEHREQISKRQKNSIKTNKFKQQVSDKLKGIKRSEETKEKMRIAAKLRAIHNCPKGMLGKKHSEETKEKMSKAKKGIVPCKDISGKYHRVSKDEFNKRKCIDLFSLNSWNSVQLERI
jgi:hypothetical protein